MSLYLCIFDGDDEIDGWVLGHYSDFGRFRDVIAESLDASRFPVLMEHSDCDGEWTPSDARILKNELKEIGEAFLDLPAVRHSDAFEHTSEHWLLASTLFDCFHNVDGENLFEALDALCTVAINQDKPILFQ
jgi:hypothetical protein